MISNESIKFYPRNIRQRITEKNEFNCLKNWHSIQSLFLSWWPHNDDSSTIQTMFTYPEDLIKQSIRSWQKRGKSFKRNPEDLWTNKDDFLSITCKLRRFLILKTSTIKNAYSSRKCNFIFFIYLVILDKKLIKFI